MGPQPHLRRIRIQKACEELETSRQRVEQIIHDVGYADASAFRKAFKDATGLSPKAYRQRFQLRESALTTD